MLAEAVDEKRRNVAFGRYSLVAGLANAAGGAGAALATVISTSSFYYVYFAIGASAFGFPFWAGGGLKIVYDLALYAGFRRRPASHES